MVFITETPLLNLDNLFNFVFSSVGDGERLLASSLQLNLFSNPKDRSFLAVDDLRCNRRFCVASHSYSYFHFERRHDHREVGIITLFPPKMIAKWGGGDKSCERGTLVGLQALYPWNPLSSLEEVIHPCTFHCSHCNALINKKHNNTYFHSHRLNPYPCPCPWPNS